MTDACNVFHYEKEAFVAHGVYYFIDVYLLDDATLVEAVVYKANVIQAKASAGMFMHKDFCHQT